MSSIAELKTERGFSMRAAGAGALASFVGFASTFTLIVNALTNVGATRAQAASGLMAVSIVMGLAGIVLSYRTRMPVSVAWSTPGAALLLGLGAVKGGYPAAVGALVLTGVLLTLAGLWRPLGRAISKIPLPIANAMLAGIILNLCVAPVHAIARYPLYVAPILLVWVVMMRIRKILAVPCAAVATLVVIAFIARTGSVGAASILPHLALVGPVFSASTMVSVAVPLFIVTMASQNIPGVAVLNVNGYRPEASRLFTATGLCSLIAAPFGGPPIGLAAITAALCAGEEAGPDQARRYWAGIVCGAAYIVYGLAASAATLFIAVAPPIIIEAVAGLALMNALGGALLNSFADKDAREAAILTFLVTMAGHAFLGIGGAFWGLLTGVGLTFLLRRAPAA
ncbi:benzoate/H(+) symporter BenE family transporter [Burkholderia glumae]|uniref:benzoate/H(+) symporter BenE family transporter n=1 Tax=Burkholderia glumae TaxID=337 RepID=UPI00137469AF|nr:benzoate/H(+) symporter BenE family transporter [Burkholderia glumae]MCR1770789.1 benzoate/H(+) symporter BenE family transporter [Burkholderia glumae]QHP93196.1 benzoate transporter BenE [Burkholderia glumae]QJP69444.1 benzoate/H(+) symporter BenE family transporter [Burkholderia glumae]QKM50792.1 Inner membrane protein YdcO [Burkholderia glumae]